MSQESSCCSLLNNAVIMDEDDTETIPSDEKRNPVIITTSAPQEVSTLRRAIHDDISPITNSVNVSTVNAAPVVNLYQPGDEESIMAVSDGRNNSLQEFLGYVPQRMQPIDPVPVPQPISSPGPQWSPGIRNEELSSLRSPDPTLNMIEATLNYLDGLPSTSPRQRRRAENDSLVSAIQQASNSVPADTSSLDGGVNVILESSTQMISETILPDDYHHDNEIVGNRSPAAHEPSPVKILTHKRTASVRTSTSPHRHMFGSTTPPPLPPMPPPQLTGSSSSLVSSRIPTRRVLSELSSIEREVRAAEEGRIKLLEQIRINRKKFESLKRESDEFIRGGIRHASPVLPYFPPTTMSSVTRSARISRATSGVSTVWNPPPRQIPSQAATRPLSTTLSTVNRLSRSYISSGAANRSCSVDITGIAGRSQIRPAAAGPSTSVCASATQSRRRSSSLNRSIRGIASDYRPPWR